ncbi:MAG: aspartate aminotransferase family protein [Gemmatimonadetes bacterium]|nr:aspartate aminotransferase family protein [Gemmatimonadota bacterium]
MLPDELRAAVDADRTREAGALFVDLVASYFQRTGAEDGPVSPTAGHLDQRPRLDEAMPERGLPLADVAARVERDFIAGANRLAHPMYMGHQVAAPLPAAVWTESVIAALNNSIAVMEMSPTGTAVEEQVIRWMCGLAGFGSGSGGTLTSGGLEATHTALLAARAEFQPDAWKRGIIGTPPVIVCGEHAHYAIARAAGELGLGTENVRTVPSDGWKMDASALPRVLDTLAAEKRRVMAVVATAGHTATGSFDDLAAIGTECETRGVWMHVDGAHGASALCSPRHAHRLRGIERARTVAWDPHKMMLLPLAAGAILARDERDLSAAFEQQAPYLFHGEAGTRSPDQGTRSFMCSRRADALKVWVALQRYGVSGLAALHDHTCALATTLHQMIGARRNFVALHEPESNILCFRWLPGDVHDEPTIDWLNLRLRERYNASGRGWITSTVLGGRRVLRVTLMNVRTEERHLEALLDGLTAEGAALVEEPA